MARPAPTRRTLIADRAPAASVALRRQVHEILEVRAAGDRTARIAEIALIVMIVAQASMTLLGAVFRNEAKSIGAACSCRRSC